MNPIDGACCDKYPDCNCSNIATKVAQKMHNLRLQEMAHDKGEACDELDCEDCCGEFVGHEFDDSEGGMCINCGYHQNW